MLDLLFDLGEKLLPLRLRQPVEVGPQSATAVPLEHPLPFYNMAVVGPPELDLVELPDQRVVISRRVQRVEVVNLLQLGPVPLDYPKEQPVERRLSGQRQLSGEDPTRAQRRRDGPDQPLLVLDPVDAGVREDEVEFSQPDEIRRRAAL